MKLTKYQKEIIKTGEVYDILSYLNDFNLTTFRKLNREAAKKRLEEKENEDKPNIAEVIEEIKRKNKN